MDWSSFNPKVKENTGLPPAGARTVAYRSPSYTALINISDSPDSVEAEVLQRLVRMVRTVRTTKKLKTPSDVPLKDGVTVSVAGEAPLYFESVAGITAPADYLLRFLCLHRETSVPGLKTVAPLIR